VGGHCAEGLRGPEAGSVGTPLMVRPSLPLNKVPGSPGAAGYYSKGFESLIAEE
jgi:hypothetical protein